MSDLDDSSPLPDVPTGRAWWTYWHNFDGVSDDHYYRTYLAIEANLSSRGSEHHRSNIMAT